MFYVDLLQLMGWADVVRCNNGPAGHVEVVAEESLRGLLSFHRQLMWGWPLRHEDAYFPRTIAVRKIEILTSDPILVVSPKRNAQRSEGFFVLLRCLIFGRVYFVFVAFGSAGVGRRAFSFGRGAMGRLSLQDPAYAVVALRRIDSLR